MSKVRLSDVKQLYLFADATTKGRRSSPIPQLTCNGRYCSKFQPNSVVCTNIGGSGSEVIWKCEADLPSNLRFGKIDVSCEGYNRPGDSYVLEGSCGLTYNLMKIDDTLERDLPKAFSKRESDTFSSLLFSIAFIGVFVLIMYGLIKACASDPGNRRPVTRPPGPTGGSSFTGSTPGGPSWFGNNDQPPPPYSPPKPEGSSGSSSGPGFWTGFGLGGAGGYLWGRSRNPDPYTRFREQPAQRSWDWERPFSTGFTTRFPSSSEGSWSSTPRSPPTNQGGSSPSDDLGSMRSSSGLARSNVR